MKFLYTKTSGETFYLSQTSVDTGASEIILSFDTQVDELLDFLKITGHSIEYLSSAYLEVQKCLSLSKDELFHALPSNTLQAALRSAVEAAQNTLCDKEHSEYLVTYLSIKRFLRSLSPAFINTQQLKKVANEEEHIPTQQRMEEFRPLKGQQQAPPTVYGVAETSTGRLVVTSGPQILTVKSSMRSAFASRFPKGEVLQIDLVAAEPNIALKATGQDHEGDVYTHISNKVLNGQVSRSSAKLITLSALYGQSYKNLSKQLPNDINPASVVRKTREFFQVEQLEAMLNSDLKAKRLKNALGRPINLSLENKRKSVNYFLQSSAAEIACLVFSKWCKDNNSKCVPCYIIHDALIVDCTEHLSRELLTDNIIKLSIGDWSFDAKVTLLREYE